MNGGSEVKKKGATSSEAKEVEDRISALPDDVLVHILSFLSMDTAVGTGILSKRWGHLWTMVRHLQYLGPSAHCSKQCKEKFVTFVNNTLVLHDIDTVDVFHLWFSFSERSSPEMTEEEVKAFATQVDVWIHFAIRRKAENIVLDFSGDDEDILTRYKLPWHFFINDHVKKIVLDYCIMDQLKPVCWTSLVELKLSYVYMSNEMFENILCGTPLLEMLILRSCPGVENININSQNLKTLDLFLSSESKLRISAPYVQTMVVGGDIAGYELVNVSSVSHVKLIALLQTIEDSHQEILNRLLASIHHVQTLTLSSDCLQVMSMLEVKYNHLVSYLNCNTINIRTNFSKWELPGMVAMLLATPELNTLVLMDDGDFEDLIDGEFKRKNDFNEMNYLWKLMWQFPWFTSKIQKVIKYDFQDRLFETKLLQLLLKEVRSLRTLLLISKQTDQDSLVETVKCLQKLLSFPRASPNAVVLFS